MSIITSVLGSLVGTFLVDRPYWAVKLANGTWQCELDSRFDLRRGEKRPFDWTLDLIDTGDIAHIRELWLFCPPTKASPLGNTARLPIVEPHTAFQFKVASYDAVGAWRKALESQVIGRVDNKETGDCTVFIWDAPLKVMSTPWQSNVYHFGSWREGIAPIGALSHAVLGLRLG